MCHVISRKMATGGGKFEILSLWTDVKTRCVPKDVEKISDVENLRKSYPAPLHVKTPLIISRRLSEKLKTNVWLKLDNLQPSQSFKLRGMSLLCQKAALRGCTRFYCSSGGNAGLAAAYSANRLSVPISVIVPESTPAFVHDLLREYGADVVVHGKVWDEADRKTKELCEKDPSSLYIPPFDHPDIWEGHSSMVHEIHEQLAGDAPDVVVVALGGGGLMCGVLRGMHQLGWSEVPVVAVETRGADSLAECVRQKKWTEIDDITSMAKCLGARRVARRAFEWLTQHPVFSVVIEDRDAVTACLQFADSHKMLVELACGAPLSMVYGDGILQLQQQGYLPREMKNIVVIVCGGSAVNVDILHSWKQQFEL